MAKDSILDVVDILNEYSKDIQEGIIQDAETIAKKGADELKNTSPKRTGKYRKGWRVKTEKGKGYVESIIYNATSYQLTHLLEKPHLSRNGRTVVAPKVHIKPVEEQCIEEYERAVEKTVKNGG